MDFQPISCPSELGDRYSQLISCFRPIKRHCDCDTPLGLMNRVLSKSQLKKWKKRIRKTGESLEQVIEQKKQTLKTHPEVAQWANLLRELLSKGNVEFLDLFIHWTSNPLIFKEKKTVRLANITKELLLEIKEDTIYSFTKK
ncbi:MAG: hypothetical protein ACXAB4_08845 [Candidatus Hodarchaeales archaeon]